MNIESIVIMTIGIDGTIIGPYDMSASFDIPGELHSPILLNAIKKVEKACHDANFPLGYHVIKPNQLEVQVKADSGYSFIFNYENFAIKKWLHDCPFKRIPVL